MSKGWLRLLGLAIGLALLAGCGTYVPEGATVVAVKNSKREYDRADMRAEANELSNNALVPMKWYDTNTFITTATLTPGMYTFRARNYDGAAIVHDIKIQADKHLYEFTEQQQATAAQQQQEEKGPAVSGRVAGHRGEKLAVLFVGREIVMRSTSLGNDGSFKVDSPRNGSWKIELHLLGDKPQSWSSQLMQVDKPVDLGMVAVK